MEYSHHPGRLEVLRRGRALQSEAAKLLEPLNDDLSEFDSHSAIVLYMTRLDDTKGYPYYQTAGEASAVATVETLQSIDPDRHRFRRENVDGHVIDLAATAFGGCLYQLQTHKHFDSFAQASRMNPGDMTWSPRPSFDTDGPIGSIQLAFDLAQHDPMPNQSTLERMYTDHAPAINQITREFQEFERHFGPLPDSLELYEPATPNSYVVR